MERIKLYSDKVWISEQEKDPEILTLRILISTFEPNLNGVLLNRATIDSWLDSILTKPLVAKIAYKTDKSGKNQIADFTGHNVSVETYIDESGLEQDRIVFDTQAFGTIVSAAIESIDGKEGIVIVAHVWRRYYTATEIIERRIKEGSLHTSWEISVTDYEKKIIGGQIVKVINRGIFSADTMLGNAYPPAFPTARILDVASDENDMELCDALVKDTMSLNENSKGNEVEKMNEEIIVNELDTGGVENAEEEKATAPERAEEARSAEGEGQEKEIVESTPEKSELTLWDLRRKVDDAICKKIDTYWLDMCWLFPVSFRAWAHKPDADELNVLEFTYSVENDEVTVSDPVEMVLTVSPREINATLSAKNETIIDLNNKVNELQAQIDALSPFKEAAETAAREKLEAQHKEAVSVLRKYAEESGMLTKDELDVGEIAELINNLKETELKVIIADRIVSKKKDKLPEVSEKKQPKVRMILSDGASSDPGSIFRSYIHK